MQDIEPETPEVTDPSSHADESLGSLFLRVMEEGKAFARAEIELYRTLAAARMADLRWAAAFALIAVVLVQGAFVALIVGLVMTVARLLGPGWATSVVFGGTLVVAAVVGWLAWRRLARAMRARERPKS